MGTAAVLPTSVIPCFIELPQPSVTMADKIIGTFNMTDSENFDEFMKALGVGMIMRKMGNSMKPSVTFTLDGDTYTMKTSSSVKTTEVKFKLGEKFSETTMDGREAETTFTLAGNVLTQNQVCAKGPGASYVRTFTDTDLVCVCECNGVKSTRSYKRA